jgi:hypothetical protein
MQPIENRAFWTGTYPYSLLLCSELQSKVEELSAAHDDMRNLLNSTEIATIFVDNEVRKASLVAHLSKNAFHRTQHVGRFIYKH